MPLVTRAWIRGVVTDVGSAVQYWLTRAEPELVAGGFSQIDIDEMFDDPPDRAVETAMRCLDEAVRAARITRPGVDAILTIPLEIADDLRLEAPQLDEWFARTWEYGPGLEVPGLYLVMPEIWRGYEGGEDYRITIPALDLLPSDFAAYYRCWRTAEDARRGHEFNRCIYVRTV